MPDSSKEISEELNYEEFLKIEDGISLDQLQEIKGAFQVNKNIFFLKRIFNFFRIDQSDYLIAWFSMRQLPGHSRGKSSLNDSKEANIDFFFENMEYFKQIGGIITDK